MNCICCNGPMRLLGALGATDHYRCRACGWDYHEPHDEGTVEDAYDDGERGERGGEDGCSSYRKV